MKTISENEYTKVTCTDEPGEGGVCHKYDVLSTEHHEELSWIQFQNGPIKEHGVNGCQNEDLLKIVIDRLEHFQRGNFACEENNDALYHCRKALERLNYRTEDRKKRGVEGLSKK